MHLRVKKKHHVSISVFGNAQVSLERKKMASRPAGRWVLIVCVSLPYGKVDNDLLNPAMRVSVISSLSDLNIVLMESQSPYNTRQAQEFVVIKLSLVKSRHSSAKVKAKERVLTVDASQLS